MSDQQPTYEEMAVKAQSTEFRERMQSSETKVLVIGGSSSKCGTCSLQLIYIDEPDAGCPSCGSVFNFCIAAYVRGEPVTAKDDCERLAPKLTFLGYGDIYSGHLVVEYAW